MRPSSTVEPPVPEGWRAVQLDDVAQILPGGRLKLTKKDYLPVGTRAFSASGQDGFVARTEFDEPGVVLSSIGARCGKCFYAAPPWTTLANTQAIIPTLGVCDSAYLFQYVNDEGYWHRSGSAQPFIAPSTVKKAWIALPPLPEQRKIAAILSSVDEAIEKTEAVIARSSVVRDAVMAEKLSRGDWDRRMGVAADHGWDEVLLDSVAHRASGHTPDRKRADYWDGGIKWLSLRDSYRLDRVYVGDTDSTISQLGIENSSAVLHKAGVVVLSRDAGVGKSAITTVDMAVSQHFLCWWCGPSLDAHFLYYWLQWMKPVFEKIAAGNTIKTIGLPFFKALKIPLPPLSYQRQVARVLKSIDDYRLAGEASVLQLSNAKAVLASELLSGNLRVSPVESVA